MPLRLRHPSATIRIKTEAWYPPRFCVHEALHLEIKNPCRDGPHAPQLCPLPTCIFAPHRTRPKPTSTARLLLFCHIIIYVCDYIICSVEQVFPASPVKNRPPLLLLLQRGATMNGFLRCIFATLAVDLPPPLGVSRLRFSAQAIRKFGRNRRGNSIPPRFCPYFWPLRV